MTKSKLLSIITVTLITKHLITSGLGLGLGLGLHIVCIPNKTVKLQCHIHSQDWETYHLSELYTSLLFGILSDVPPPQQKILYKTLLLV